MQPELNGSCRAARFIRSPTSRGRWLSASRLTPRRASRASASGASWIKPAGRPRRGRCCATAGCGFRRWCAGDSFTPDEVEGRRRWMRIGIASTGRGRLGRRWWCWSSEHAGHAAGIAPKQVADGIAAVLPHAQAAGVKLAFEPLHPMYAADRSCINRMAEARLICEAAEPSDAGDRRGCLSRLVGSRAGGGDRAGGQRKKRFRLPCQRLAACKRASADRPRPDGNRLH
jgi:hypothetical protein